MPGRGSAGASRECGRDRPGSSLRACVPRRTSSARWRSVRPSPCATSRCARRGSSTSCRLTTRRWWPRCRTSRRPSTCCWRTSRTPSRRRRRRTPAPASSRSPRTGTARHPALDAGQLARLAVGARRPRSPPSPRPATPLDVIMVPKVEGPEDIHYVDRLLAQLEAKARLRAARCSSTPSSRPHAASPTSRRSAPPRRACRASRSARPTSAANRRMKTTRVGGGHPGYLVRADPDPDDADAPRADVPAGPVALHDRPHGRRLRRPTACCRTTARSATSPTPTACEDQFRNAYLLGCVGAWSLHPAQVDIAKRVFSPPPADVAHARRVIEAMGDGTGAVLLDGKMEDDASVKQCKVVIGAGRAARRPRPGARRSRTGSSWRERAELRPRRSVLYMPCVQRPGAGEGQGASRATRSSSTSRTPSRPTPSRRPATAAVAAVTSGELRRPRADDPLQRPGDAVGRRRPRRRRRGRARPPS